MGLTALALIYSPWGKRSGAQMNPAMTLSFLRMGRLTRLDAIGYVSAQFLGAVLGVAIMSFVLRRLVSNPHVNYAATVPGFCRHARR